MMTNRPKCEIGKVCNFKNDAFIIARFLDKETNSIVKIPICGACYLKLREENTVNSPEYPII